MGRKRKEATRPSSSQTPLSFDGYLSEGYVAMGPSGFKGVKPLDQFLQQQEESVGVSSIDDLELGFLASPNFGDGKFKSTDLAGFGE